MKYSFAQGLVAILMLTSLPAISGTIFKCKNAAGVLIYQERPCEKEDKAVTSWAANPSTDLDEDAQAGAAGNKPLVIGQGNGGHYFINAQVNGSKVNFLVDTGATTVALPLAMAVNAKLKCQKMDLMHTGNGITQGCTVTIQKLKLEHITLHYVDAVVLPNLSMPLLGMNVLRQFRIEQDNGQMRLSRKY
ncbi:MAG: aspartyl protease-like protein [Comamonadaceae bacterium]|nr:MAG: aspartyl protease-like protein [Comamonadaceae bacterium]